MPPPPQSVDDAFGRKLLRQALRAWDDSGKLAAAPAAATPVAAAAGRSAGYRDTPSGRALALRALLRQALNALRPGDADPDPADPRWRAYLILTEQYLHGRLPDYLAGMLSLARSTFDHEQAAALERLGAILREWNEHGLPGSPAETAPPAEVHLTPHLAPPLPEQPLFGRRDLLDACVSHLLGPARNLALTGLPGAGKTALAIALAHDERIRAAYPDGVLWAGLGQHPDLAARLGAWALAIGWTMDELASIPAVEDRARVLQAALHARRMLIVLDDAWSLPAARALQLGGPHAAHLITTRLPALAADLAPEHTLSVPELDAASGRALLASFAAGVPEEAADRLVSAVGGLPLALVLMGRHLRLEGRTAQVRRIEAALTRLLDPGERLGLTEGRPALDAQPSLPIETPITLHRVIALSDAGLSPGTRAMLGALAAFPPKPNTFSEDAALAASAGDPHDWDVLLDAGLVDPVGSGRYALHPSVADYAATLGGAVPAALRLIEWAADLPAHPSSTFTRLSMEEANALAALRAARAAGQAGAVVRLLGAWFDAFEAAGRLQALAEFLDFAVDHAPALGTARERCSAFALRARSRFHRGDYAAVADDARLSLEMADAAGDAHATCAAWQLLALAAQARGDIEEAWNDLEHGLPIARRAELVREQAELLTNRAALSAKRGETDEARRTWQTALSLARSLGERRLEVTLLVNVSVIAAQSGELETAERGFAEALELAHAGGDRATMSALLINLGALAFDRGEIDRAEERFREALRLAQDRGDPAAQVHILANLGRVVAAHGALDEAGRIYAEALSLGRRIGHQEHLTQALINAGALHRLRGQTAEARVLLEEAHALARALAHPRFIAAAQAELDLLRP
jgi:tetratricopeptide (TPR) repeat protein